MQEKQQLKRSTRAKLAQEVLWGPSQGAPQGGMLPEPTAGLLASCIGPMERLRAADLRLVVLGVSPSEELPSVK